MLQKILTAVVFSGALFAWLYALYHWLQSLGHRRPEVSLGKLLFNGFAAFDESNFTERGQVHVRGFVRGFAAFFFCIALGVGLAFLFLERKG